VGAHLRSWAGGRPPADAEVEKSTRRKRLLSTGLGKLARPTTNRDRIVQENGWQWAACCFFAGGEMECWRPRAFQRGYRRN